MKFLQTSGGKPTEANPYDLLLPLSAQSPFLRETDIRKSRFAEEQVVKLLKAMARRVTSASR